MKSSLFVALSIRGQFCLQGQNVHPAFPISFPRPTDRSPSVSFVCHEADENDHVSPSSQMSAELFGRCFRLYSSYQVCTQRILQSLHLFAIPRIHLHRSSPLYFSLLAPSLCFSNLPSGRHHPPSEFTGYGDECMLSRGEFHGWGRASEGRASGNGTGTRGPRKMTEKQLYS